MPSIALCFIIPPMSRDDAQVNFRMPHKLKDKLAAAAKQNHRSLTAEIVDRLENSFEQTGIPAEYASVRLIEALRTVIEEVEGRDAAK